MAIINLRDYYPFYQCDAIMELPDELATQLNQWRLDEQAHKRKMYRYHAQYSLDRGDGIENQIRFVSLSPCEIYERKITAEQLHAAIAALPDKQGKRIYAHYILGVSKAAIARAEGVAKSRVTESIERGLRNMETFLKNML